MTERTSQRWSITERGYPRISGLTGFDTEERDHSFAEELGAGWCFPDNRGEIVGYSFCWGEKGQRWKLYLPIRHRGGGNFDVAKVNRFVADTLAQKDLQVALHNRLYDEGWCRREGIPIRAKVYDIGTAAPLLDEYKHRYSLDALAWEYLNRRKSNDVLVAACTKHNVQARAQGWLEYPDRTRDALKLRNRWVREQQWDPKDDLWQMPGGVVAPYAEDDAEDALELWETFKPLLVKDDLWGIFAMETQLLPVLLEMRWRGVRVDVDKADQTRIMLLKREAEVQAQIKSVVGFNVDPFNANDLAKAFNWLDIPFNDTPRTGRPSFTKDFLKSVEHPFAEMVRQLRRYNRTRLQFVEAYVLQKHCRGRVYGECVPLPSEEGGAVTGRFSMRNPNLENLINPEKDLEMGRAVRELMLPEEGQRWAALDYKQQEPALMIHFASVMKIRGAQAAVNAYWAADKKWKETGDPKDRFDFHRFIMEVTGLPRVYAKPINLGIGYGMGGAKLCRQLGLPTKMIMSKRQGKMIEVAGEEGQAILDKYHKMAPFVKGITEECERRAKRRGYIRTLLGRRCRFAIGEGMDHHYKACNRLIQGSAADQTKKAMLDMWDAGEVPLVPVHDELGCSVEDIGHAKRLAEIMTNTVQLRIPVSVDIEIGESWGATVKEEAA